jgi:hypothetical protein
VGFGPGGEAAAAEAQQASAATSSTIQGFSQAPAAAT